MPISGARKSTRAEEDLSPAYQQPPRAIVRQPEPAANAYALLLASMLFSWHRFSSHTVKRPTAVERKEKSEDRVGAQLLPATRWRR